MARATTGGVTNNFTLIYFGFTSTGYHETNEKRAKIQEKTAEKRVTRRDRVTSDQLWRKIRVSMNPYKDALCRQDVQDVYHAFGAFTKPIILVVA